MKKHSRKRSVNTVSSSALCLFIKKEENLRLNTISLSRHEQVCLMRPDDGRSISRNVASLNILVHDVINLLYYEH